MTSSPRPVRPAKAAPPEPAVLILVSCGGRNDAERLGEQMVEQRLAARASVIPTVFSIFRWEGRLQREHEALLIVKTTVARSAEAEAYIKEHHGHRIPEILHVAVEGGSTEYLAWLASEVRPIGDNPSS